MPTAQN